MRPLRLPIVLAQAVLVAVFGVALRARGFPLGVPGDWEWLRLPAHAAPAFIDLLLAGAVVAAYAVGVALGWTFLNARRSISREVAAVAGLVVGAVAVQAVVPVGAPSGYDLAKWAIALHNSGSSGYFTVARQQIRDPWRFLADYPAWIERQDALHVGTHPPGLFLVAHGMRHTMESHPETARYVVAHLPGSVASAFRTIHEYDPLSRADRAALALTGALTLLACAATVAPLYLLARASLPPPMAWAVAALWPLAPSALLFQPAADTAFPFLSTLAMALAAHAATGSCRRDYVLSLGTGLILALGMFFTLAFLPVGLIVAVLIATAPGIAIRPRLVRIALVGPGFLAPVLAGWVLTRANPFVIWWWNQRHHARFYVEYPRRYWSWVAANPIELIVAIGLPTAVWIGLGLVDRRRAPGVSWATLAVLTFLTLSGKNLSEVARLWLPLMPPLLVAAGTGMERLDAGRWTLAGTILLVGAETLTLQATIQVVYPI